MGIKYFAQSLILGGLVCSSWSVGLRIALQASVFTWRKQKDEENLCLISYKIMQKISA